VNPQTKSRPSVLPSNAILLPRKRRVYFLVCAASFVNTSPGPPLPRITQHTAYNFLDFPPPQQFSLTLRPRMLLLGPQCSKRPTLIDPGRLRIRSQSKPPIAPFSKFHTLQNYCSDSLGHTTKSNDRFHYINYPCRITRSLHPYCSYMMCESHSPRL